MTVYLVGNAPADFDSPQGAGSALIFGHQSGGVQASPTNQGGCVTAVLGTGTGFEIDFSQPTSDFWITFYTECSTRRDGNDIFSLVDGNNISLLRFVSVTDQTFRVELWNGSSYTTVITSIAFNPDTDPSRFDVKFKIHDTAGVIEVYKSDVLVGSYSGDTLLTASTAISRARFKQWRGGNSSWTYVAFYSQILAMDTSTRGIEVIQEQPNAATTYAGQDSGGLTDINAVVPTTTVDTSKMVFSVADAKSAFTTTSMDTSYNTGWQVVSVISTARASRGTGSSISTVAPMVRTSTGVDAFASPQTTTETLFKPHFSEFTVNPDTTSAWTVAEANAAAVGLRVAT
tara:strand:- start:78 stop:1109 length:1032 start_codon:yes stop_codon:yes gene_type:complete